MITPQHCPGFEQFRELESFTCTCPECGEEIEIFSDEFNKAHNCPACGKLVDFTQCALSGRGRKNTPR